MWKTQQDKRVHPFRKERGKDGPPDFSCESGDQVWLPSIFPRAELGNHACQALTGAFDAWRSIARYPALALQTLLILQANNYPSSLRTSKPRTVLG